MSTAASAGIHPTNQGVARPVLYGLVAIFVGVAVLFAALHGVYGSLFDNRFFAFALWGAAVIYATTRPSKAELGISALLTVVLYTAYWQLGDHTGIDAGVVIRIGAAFGASSIVILCAKALNSRAHRQTALPALRGAALFVVIMLAKPVFLTVAALALPAKLDLFLQSFDNSLGIETSAAVAREFIQHPFTAEVATLIYCAVGLFCGLVYAVNASSKKRWPVNVLLAFSANALVGYCLYFAFPAAGPKYAFPGFPYINSQIARPHPIQLSALPNALPSLHMSTAFLCLWLVRPWNWLRAAMLAVVGSTFVATLGLGEHYLVDLIVALPFSVAMFAIAAPVKERRQALAISGANVAMWIGVLRLSNLPAAAAWALVMLTVALSFTLQYRLEQAVLRIHLCTDAPADELDKLSV